MNATKTQKSDGSLKQKIEELESYKRELLSDLTRRPERKGTQWYTDREREYMSTRAQLKRLHEMSK